MRPHLLFLGGNGHCAARLGPARDTLARLGHPFTLVDPQLPGFENRPRAASLDGFLDAVAGSIPVPCTAVYGTGIGGLLALCLRSRGQLTGVPLLLQAPVLWGLEHRLMPRLMRFGLVRQLLQPLFAWSWFQRHFVKKYFQRELPPELREAFFRGYAECGAAVDFFQWLTPQLLRTLERCFSDRPEGLTDVTIWWGERDRVVSLQELQWTHDALRVAWPRRTFPTWGHYPMIDDPDGWVRALADELAAVERLPRSDHSETR